MIQVTIDEIKPGMILGRSLYHDNGDLLLALNYTLNEKVIAKLKSLSLNYLWIQEEGTESIIPQQLISDQLTLQCQETIKDNMDILVKIANVQALTIAGINEAVKDKGKFKDIILAGDLKRRVADIIDALLEKQAATVNLNSIRTKDNYLFQHSLDVTITAILIANKLKLNRYELEELALGCILMDLGMVLIPGKLLENMSRLSYQEFAILREHATYGYFILRENIAIPLISAHVAYQHHERQDGGGYPRQLRGDNTFPEKKRNMEKGKIHRYAEIAAVADTYVGLVSPRPGCGHAKSPDEAMRTLITGAGSHLNRKVVDAILSCIQIYPTGARVVITQDNKYNMKGHYGVVARYQAITPDRPHILILFDANHKRLTPQTIKLENEPGIQIQFVVLD